MTRAIRERALADALGRRGKCLLDALAEALAVLVLVAVGLHRADLVQRLVDVDADVGHARLARARQRAHAPSVEQDRRDHQRHAEQHQRGELGAGHEQHHQAARHDQGVAQRE